MPLGSCPTALIARRNETKKVRKSRPTVSGATCRSMVRTSNKSSKREPVHPRVARRALLQAGGVGLLGLGIHHLDALSTIAATARVGSEKTRARSVIFVFLSGGAPQHDTFDPKPEAPDSIRGEFRAIATRTPGI